MIRSMTGYGEASAENERHRLGLTLKSVNHRFLDLNIRLPEELKPREAELRRQLGDRLQRGRVEARYDLEYLGERRCRIEIRRGVVEALREALGEAGLEQLATELSLSDLLALPEAVSLRMLPGEWEPEDALLLQEVTGEALNRLIAAREGEGERLQEFLEQRLRELEDLLRLSEERRQEVKEATRAALSSRLAELLGDAGLPEERLAQEAAILVEKSDIQEELDRLRSHLQEFRSALKEGGALGRRMDFLTQEIQRELNTAGAKSRDAELTRLLLEARQRSEQVKEQIQNVE